MNILYKIMSLILICSFVIIAGCTQAVRKTGFLSDYSRLEPSNGSLRYINLKRLGEYSKFIIEPVDVYLYDKSQSTELDFQTRVGISNYMHQAIINSIKDRYMIVSRPGLGVARLRVAITDIEKSTPALNILPQTKMTGLGLGGASMEGELLDSQTGEQIGALIESQKGKRISMSGLKKWGDAKSVMNDWAERFRKRLDEAHDMK